MKSPFLYELAQAFSRFCEARFKRLRGRCFVGEALDLTGWDVENCYFDECNLHLNSGGPQFRLVRNTFNSCRLYGDGWPDNFLEQVGIARSEIEQAPRLH